MARVSVTMRDTSRATFRRSGPQRYSSRRSRSAPLLRPPDAGVLEADRLRYVVSWLTGKPEEWNLIEMSRPRAFGTCPLSRIIGLRDRRGCA